MGRTVSAPDALNDGSAPQIPFPREIAAATIDYRYAWDDNWIPMPEAEFVSASLTSAHGGISQCAFRRRYGSVKMPFEPDYVTRDPYVALNLWIRARIYFEGADGAGMQPHTVFVGMILSEDRTVHNTGRSLDGSDVPSGEQVWQAVGPMAILDRIHISRSFWGDGAGGTDEIGWLPEINYRDRKRRLIGNRSDDLGPDDVYLYGGRSTWTARQYIDYLLEKFAKQGAAPANPPWRLTGSALPALDDIARDIPLGEVETVASIMRRIIHPRFGLDFTASWYGDSATTTLGFDIDVFALSPYEYSFNAQTLPANPDALTIVTPHEPELFSVHLSKSSEHAFDELRVRGARVVVCCSLEGDALTKRWSDALEAQYISLSGLGTQFADLIRRRPAFRDVFQAFGAPDDWDHNGGTAAPVFDLNGELVGTGAVSQALIRETLPWLPLVVGGFYGAVPPVEQSLTDADPGYSGPLLFVRERATGWRLNAFDADIGVGPLAHGIGVQCSSNPNHILAANQSMATAHEYPYFAWEDAVATVAFRLDQAIELGFDVPADERIGDGSRHVVHMPEAEVWVLVEGTAVDVDPSTGAIIRAPETIILRDDTDRMAVTMAGEIARHYLFRGRASCRAIGHAAWAQFVGQILGVIDEGGFSNDIQGAITSVTWTTHGESVQTQITAGLVR